MVWEHRERVAIAGVGFSTIDRKSSTPLTTHAMRAAQSAVSDCGLELRDIDGLATYPTAPFAGARNVDGEDVITPEFFLGHPSFGAVSWYSQAGAGMIPTAVRDAVHAIIAGACSYALVWRAMFEPPGTYGRVTTTHFGDDTQFAAPWGITSPIQWHALAYRRYLETYAADQEMMEALVVSSRRNANRNPNAWFADRPLADGEYLSASMISDPLRLLDCDIPVTSCVALVLTTTDRARQLRHPPALIAAVGQQTVPRPPSLRYVLHDHIDSGRPLADQLWRDSGRSAGEMSAAQLYDGFSPSALYWLEAAGFCGRGEALEFIQDGRIEIGGQLPLNTFGGSLSQGRLHGMGHLAEAVLQVSDRAGDRQVDGAHSVCVLDGSPMLRGGGLVITRDT